MTDLSLPIYTDANAAREHLEALRWPDGPYCPHCGELEQITKMQGKSTRPGVYKCRSCRKPFSVTVGTLFERSHIPLNKWLLATHLMSASKKGMSAHQLHRMMGITYKSAWFMAHRIREAMRPDSPAPLGGPGKTIEADETYFGKREKPLESAARKGRPFTKKGKSGGARNKMAVVSLVERGGSVRTFQVDHVNAANVREILIRNVSRASTLYTDESKLYHGTGHEFGAHETVKHSAREYVRGAVHTNTVEGFFSIFKRGMKGVYQHCAEKHLHRYLAEFDFRYNTRISVGFDDTMRAEKALQGIVGKRLMYRRPDEAKVA